MRCYICDFTEQSSAYENHSGLPIKHSRENKVVMSKGDSICLDCLRITKDYLKVQIKEEEDYGE